MMTGYPILRAILTASRFGFHRTIRTRNDRHAGFPTVSFATALSPIILMDFDFGPMNLMLQDSHCSAKFAFSERKP